MQVWKLGQGGAPLPSHGGLDAEREPWCQLRGSDSISIGSALGGRLGPDESEKEAPREREFRSARLRAKRCEVRLSGADADDELEAERRRKCARPAGARDAFEALLGRRVAVPRRARSGPTPLVAVVCDVKGIEAPPAAPSCGERMPAAGPAPCQPDMECEDAAVAGLLRLADNTVHPVYE